MNEICYPKRNHLLKSKCIDNEYYHLINVLTDDEWWEVHEDTIEFLEMLDGKKNPYEIDSCLAKEEVDEILEFYRENGWLYNGETRIIKDGFWSVFFTLWIPKINKGHHIFASIWNYLLMMLCIPVFLSGIHVLIQENYPYVQADQQGILGLMVGLVVGGCLHELSHAMACMADRNGKLLEIGVMNKYFIPGFYACFESENIESRLKRVQVLAAGIEMNLMLTGVFLILLNYGWFDSKSLVYAASVNFMIAILNLALIDTLDGMKILSELLGVEELVGKSEGLIEDSLMKEKVKDVGISGTVTIILAYIIKGFQMLLILFIILNLSPLGYWFS